MMRVAFLLLFLAACGDGADEANAPLVAEGAKVERVECAMAGETTFTAACTAERTISADGLTLTLRSPTGGFRRLLVTKDGRGVVAADGAEQAVVTPLGPNGIEVAVAGERYRLPATVKQ